MSTYYLITVRGHLEDHWSAWFDGLTITHRDNGEALLAGPVMDQAALHGLLIKIRDLGLPLIAVVPGSTPQDDGTGNRDRLDERNNLAGNSGTSVDR
jgi:hypothetical protein